MTFFQIFFLNFPICLLCSRDDHHKNTMQNKKLVQIVIWVIVISMVMSLLIAAISLF